MDDAVPLLYRSYVRVSVDMNDRELDPPETCTKCGEFHSMKYGLCWQCYEEEKAIAAEAKSDEMREKRRFENETNA